MSNFAYILTKYELSIKADAIFDKLEARDHRDHFFFTPPILFYYVVSLWYEKAWVG